VAEFEIAGSGVLEANGKYTSSDSHDRENHPEYTNLTNSAVKIQWCSESSIWTLINEDGTVLYVTVGNDNMNFPLDAEWSLGQCGRLPLPKTISKSESNVLSPSRFIAAISSLNCKLAVLYGEAGAEIIDFENQCNKKALEVQFKFRIGTKAVFSLDGLILALYSLEKYNKILSIYSREDSSSDEWTLLQDTQHLPNFARSEQSLVQVSSFNTGLLLCYDNENTRSMAISIWDLKLNKSTTLSVDGVYEYEYGNGYSIPMNLKICVSSNGKFVAIRKDTNSVSVLESVNKVELYEFEYEYGRYYNVTSLSISNTGHDTLLLTGFENGRVVISSLLSGSRIHDLHFNYGAVHSVDLSASGKYLATTLSRYSGNRPVAVIRNLAQYELVHEFRFDSDRNMRACCVSKSAPMLVFNLGDQIFFCDLVSGVKKPISSIPSFLKGQNQVTDEDWNVNSLCLSPDSRYLATGHSNNKTLVIDTVLWKVRNTFESVAELPEITEDLEDKFRLSGIRAVSISSDGKLACGGTDHRVTVRNLSDGKTLNIFRHEGPVNFICFSSDSKYLASGGSDKKNSLRKLNKTDSIILHHDAFRHNSEILTACFCPETKLLISGGMDGTVRVWIILSGEPKFEFSPQLTRPVSVFTVSVAKSKDG
jgi:WD40 repeat protein